MQTMSSIRGPAVRFFASKSFLEPNGMFVNRNPRNLERMRIGYKPDGYHVERPGRRFWHKLQLEESGRYVTASLNHFENGTVLKVSTLEWPIKQQLYRYNDMSAYLNLGRVFAERCLRLGLTEFSCDLDNLSQSKKALKFIEVLKESGIVLEEPAQFKPASPWDQYRPEKPWEVQ